MDDISRRGFLLAGLGVLVAGCGRAGSGSLGFTNGPSPQTLPPGSTYVPGDTPPRSVHSAQPLSRAGGPTIIPRSRWSVRSPITSRMNRMNGIRSITVHHEGMPTPTVCTAEADVIRELRLVQTSHINRMQAGDIGYHYVIDRVGRIWEGRSIALQGAHVKYNNPHNIGVMVMGNFEKQYPTAQQKQKLTEFLSWLMERHNVPMRSIHTHRELRATTCPGRHLQPHVDAFRERA